VEESRQKLFVQLFVMATVVSLSLILTVYIASTYYKDVSDLSFWTPVPSNTLTATNVPPTRTPTSPPPTPTSVIVPVNTAVKNCTYSAVYWAYHPEKWPPQIVVGSFTYTKEEALSILQTGEQDSTAKLFAQFHAAILNFLSGTTFDVVKQNAIEASDWLNSHPIGSQTSDEDRKIAETLSKILENYNLGNTGPGRCQDEPSSPVLAPTDTSSPTVTITQTETPTVRPTVRFVPSDTSRPVRIRTATNTPLAPPPTKPPTKVPPTKPPTPVPTNTPKPTPAP
jgi:hypothetical protein